MIPSQSLPIPEQAPPATWTTFKVRLENWIQSVVQSFRSQVLNQVDVTQVTPDVPGPAWIGTVPYTIGQLADGTPQAGLVADGVVQFFTTGALGAGQWNLQTLSVAGTPTVVVVLGAPATTVWFAFLVAR